MDHDLAAAPRFLPIQSRDDLTRRLLNYFGSVGAPLQHLFTLRDINLQVMMHAYQAPERALLGVALAGLVDDGALVAESPTSYRLTDQGLVRVRGVRPHAGRRPD